MGEWVGVSIALLSSCLGGTAAAITRYLVTGADPISLAILRWGIGFVCLLPGGVSLESAMAAVAGLAGGRASGARLLRTVLHPL
jgi:hypothetical protein